MMPECADAYIKASECYRKLDSMFMAAKAVENAASIYAQQKQAEKAAETYRLTSDYYHANGSADKAADALEKAAKQIETSDLDGAVKDYRRACELLETEDKGRFAADIYRRAIALLLRNGRVEEAETFMRRLCTVFKGLGNKVQLNKMGLSVVVALLALGDEIGAKRAAEEFEWVYCREDCGIAANIGMTRADGFGNSDEGAAADELISAFESGDAEKLQLALGKHTLTYLDNEVVRLARTLRVPEGRSAAPEPSREEAAQTADSMRNLQDEIEQEGIM